MDEEDEEMSVGWTHAESWMVAQGEMPVSMRLELKNIAKQCY